MKTPQLWLLTGSREAGSFWSHDVGPAALGGQSWGAPTGQAASRQRKERAGAPGNVATLGALQQPESDLWAWHLQLLPALQLLPSLSLNPDAPSPPPLLSPPEKGRLLRERVGRGPWEHTQSGRSSK